MNIGILTLPFNNNYGGYLQCYALMTFLKKSGHNPELIYRRHNRRSAFWTIEHSLKNIVKYLVGRPIPCIIPNQEKELRYRGAKMMPFVDNNIFPKTSPLYSDKSFYKAIEGKYDAIIVGSDQVWRPNYGPNVTNYFLANLHDDHVLRISYSASFGSDTPVFTDAEKKVCGAAIEKFDYVSLREDSGVNIFNSFGWKTKRTPSVVLDPTFIINKSEYLNHIAGTTSLAKGKAFCYVLDKSPFVRSFIKKISTNRNLEEYNIIDTDVWTRYDYIMPSVEDWLSGIRDADLVITDSFHGMVFSIIFNKEFVVFGNERRGKARFLSLLAKFGLEDRFIDINTHEDMPNSMIDWVDVNQKLTQLKDESVQFLKKSLSINNNEENTYSFTC